MSSAILSASSRENGSRAKPTRLKLLAARIRSEFVVEETAAGASLADRTLATRLSFDLFFFAAASTRGSFGSKTGSAMIARVFAAGCRPTVSGRRATGEDADGRRTISWLAINGEGETGSVANGVYSNAPEATIASRLSFHSCRNCA